MNKEFEKTPDQHIAEALNRWTVTDLRELTDADLDRGFERLDKASDIRVIGGGQVGVIKYWNITSGGNKYQVRRFENFCFCSCLDFFFSKTACKHLVVTTKAFRKLERAEMDSAKYIKPSTPYKGEKVGNIRI